MTPQEKLNLLLSNPEKTSDVIDSIQKEIKEESVKIYDEVFKDFKGDYRKEYKELRDIAKKRLDLKEQEIRKKYFNTLVG